MAKEANGKYPTELLSHYVMKDTLGSGGFAKVKLARHRVTGEKVAIKIMDKAELLKTDDLKRVSLEVQALKDLRHQNIARLYHVIETDDKFYLIQELAPGGELFDYIVARDRLKEDEARFFFRQICKAVYHCHQHGYAHRDLKPENLLLDANRNIKLIDFGLVGHPFNLKENKLKTCCGSAAYAAPELIRGDRYLGEPADVWSLGILLYALLCGFLPFDDDNTQKLYRLIQRGQYEIPEWLSESSQRILAAMLKHRPEHRISMEKLLEHPWMLKGTQVNRIDPASSYGDISVLESTVVSEMAKYYGITTDEAETLIREWKYDNITAEYELLCLRRSKGHSVRLPASKGKLSPSKATALMRTKPSLTVDDSDEISSFGSTLNLHGSGENIKVGLSSGPYLQMPGSIENLYKSGIATSSEDLPRANGLSNITAVSMDHIPTASEDTASLVRHASNPQIPSTQIASSSTENPLQAPQRKSFRGSFGSIARGFRNLFGSSHRLHEPRKVKGVFGVATTSSKPPMEIYQELMQILQDTGCQIKEKGFLIKAKFPSPEDDGTFPLHINFEVCRISGMDKLVGIKLTRVKGDTWLYKRACEDVVGQLHL